MSEGELLAALRGAGDRLAAFARAAGLHAAVPSCPEWDVRQLVRHTGGVHRWAARTVSEAAVEPLAGSEDLESFVGGWPADSALLGWFSEGVERLVATLGEAPAGLECFTFLPAPSARWFWTRRQAHETTIHAVDAELAAGGAPEPEAELAVDGLDELLGGVVPRMRRRLSSAEGERLGLVASDTGDAFVLSVREAGTSYEARRGETFGESAAEASRSAELAAPAARLYLWAWARAGREALSVSGDEEVVEHFEGAVHVNW